MPKFDHHVRIRQQLSFVGFSDKGQVTDENGGLLDLFKNGINYRHHARLALRIVIYLWAFGLG